MNCSNCGADSKTPVVCSTCGVPLRSKQSSTKTPSPRTNTRDISSSAKVNGVFTEANNQEENLSLSIKKLKTGLVLSFGFSILLLISGLVYVSQTQEKINTLESDLSYFESSISNLEYEMNHIKDWGYGEIDSVVNCVNNFIDSWSDRLPAFYCLDPMAP